jgi:hypothetical protein
VSLPKPTRRGRPPHRDSVTAISNGDGVIAVTLSADLAHALGIGAGNRFWIGFGSARHHGKLLLARARANDTSTVPAYTAAGKIGFNLRRQFLPDAQHPLEQSVVLPHELLRNNVLAIDVSPLAKRRAAASSPSSAPYQTEQP